MLLALPACNNVGGNPGYVVYLAALTEWNDVAQYLAGKSLASAFPYKIAPRISPSKTWVGFVGGMIGTCGLALVLAPRLTPFDHEEVRHDTPELTLLRLCSPGL
jgi:phosphatidate cytidylyltransferase